MRPGEAGQQGEETKKIGGGGEEPEEEGERLVQVGVDGAAAMLLEQFTTSARACAWVGLALCDKATG